MPLNPKGTKIIAAMRKQYGEKRGTSVFYASRNKGTIKGVDPESGGRMQPPPHKFTFNRPDKKKR